MTIHNVKSWPAFFEAMISGRKMHDMRDKRDRDYKVGDGLVLHEWDPFTGAYSGRKALFEITYITGNESPCAMSSAALDRNFVILSVKMTACEGVVPAIVKAKFPGAAALLTAE